SWLSLIPGCPSPSPFYSRCYWAFGFLPTITKAGQSFPAVLCLVNKSARPLLVPGYCLKITSLIICSRVRSHEAILQPRRELSQVPAKLSSGDCVTAGVKMRHESRLGYCRSGFGDGFVHRALSEIRK